MTIFYSQTTGGFYKSEIHGEKKPQDCVVVPYETYVHLLESQAAGKIIRANSNGFPVSMDLEPLSKSEEAWQKILVLEALQTPRRLREAINGTDNGWLSTIDSQISELRAQIKKNP